MNKREARQRALEIVEDLLYSEINSPSGLTSRYCKSTEDFNKIADALSDIKDLNQRKADRLAAKEPHVGQWMQVEVRGHIKRDGNGKR